MRVIKVNKRRGISFCPARRCSRRRISRRSAKHSRRSRRASGSRCRQEHHRLRAFLEVLAHRRPAPHHDMSWGRINHPSSSLPSATRSKWWCSSSTSRRAGSLGFKQLKADPWEKVGDRYPSGTRIKGKVVSLTDYGAFIELEEGVEGLIHVSEMSWTKKVKHPRKSSTRRHRRRGPFSTSISSSAGYRWVSNRRAEPLDHDRDPLHRRREDHRQGPQPDRFRRVCRGGGGDRRLIHISDLPGHAASSTPPKILKKGDTVRGDDPQDRRRESASVARAQAAGTERYGTISSPTTRSVTQSSPDRPASRLRRLRRDCGGRRRPGARSELADERIEHPKDKFAVDQIVRAKVIKMDQAERKIGLSIKSARSR